MPNLRPRRPTRSAAGETGGATAAPPGRDGSTRILVATNGASFDRALIDRVVELAHGLQPKVVVLSIAKIFGTSLGIPHPGLYPTRREVEEQKRIVEDAARQLKRRGMAVRTKVIATRKAAKAIARFAEHTHCKAIVIADPEVPRWRRIVEGTLAGELGRKTEIPVHAVPIPVEGGRGRKAG